MTEIKGEVAAKSRLGTGLMINGSWYNGSKDMLADVDKGDRVTLSHGDNRQVTGIVKTGSAPAPSATPNASDARQHVIIFQSARNAAIELHASLIANGLLSVPAKKDAKYDASMAFINEHTIRFHEQALALYAGKTAEEVFDIG